MAQHLVEAKQRADRVAVRSRVRREQECIALVNLVEYLVDHGENERPSPKLRPSSLLRAPEQLVNPRRVLLGAVDHKQKLGSVSQSHALGELMANETLGCVQSLQRLLSFVLFS